MLHYEIIAPTTRELLNIHMADGKPLQWKRIEKRLLSMDRYLERVFEAL